MADHRELGEVVASRVMLFRGEDGSIEHASIKVGRPVEDDGSWRCAYEIRTECRCRIFAMHGVDAIQALELTMKILPLELQAWERTRQGVFLLPEDVPEGPGTERDGASSSR